MSLVMNWLNLIWKNLGKKLYESETFKNISIFPKLTWYLGFSPLMFLRHHGDELMLFVTNSANCLLHCVHRLAISVVVPSKFEILIQGSQKYGFVGFENMIFFVRLKFSRLHTCPMYLRYCEFIKLSNDCVRTIS